MKRILATLLCVLLLMGCGTEGSEYVPTGDALVIDGVTEPPTEDPDAVEQQMELAYYPKYSLNPYFATNIANRVLFSLVYQGLFATDSNYESVPILCSQMTVSEDMRTYTIYLDPKASFSDGSKVTLEDVLASYEAARKSVYYSGRFVHVSGFALTEEGGISFRLNTAMEKFPLLLDIPIVKAAEVDAERPIGSGPYYYEEGASGLRLRRRGDWWCTSDIVVTANAIPLQEVESPRLLRDAFEFSNVGLACADPCSDSYVEYRCDFELWDCDNGTFLYLGLNITKPVLQNVAFRSALTYAIDRQTLSDKYYHGFAQPASLPCSPSSPYYSKLLAERYDYDPDAFSSAVASSYPLGSEIMFLVNKDDTMRLRVARDIAETLKSHNINIKLEELSTKAYNEWIKYGMYDIYLGQTKLSPNMDLSPFFRGYGSLSGGILMDEALYSMCQQALANSGNYFNLHENVMEDGRIVPVLFYIYSIHATRGLVTGLRPSRDNVFCYSIGKTLGDVVQ